MRLSSSKWVFCSLICGMVLGSSSESWARYNTGAYRRYIQQQQRQYMAMMQMEQKAMMMAIAQQQAIEKHQMEMEAKASKSAHDKELKHRQDIIARRKAAQAQQPATAKTSTREESSSPDKKP
jgi:ATPase subunit of ABC transporter with duplicated ATPase domains